MSFWTLHWTFLAKIICNGWNGKWHRELWYLSKWIHYSDFDVCKVYHLENWPLLRKIYKNHALKETNLGLERVPKNQFRSGFGYQINFNYGSGWAQVQVKLFQKALTSPATWSIDTKLSNMCLGQHQIFTWPQRFSAFLSCDELQINQYYLWDW